MRVAFSTDLPKKVPSIQEWIALICVLGMLIGFMVSRAVMSISMIVMFANIFWPSTIKHTFKSFMKFPFGILCIVYFILVFIGGIWSENQIKWMDDLTLFLPMLVLPISMLSLPFYKIRFKRIFLIAWYAIILVTIGNSVYQFLLHPQDYISGYAHSKVIPTIKYNDHIRFSLLLSLSILPGYSYIESWILKKEGFDRLKMFIIFSIVIIISYLHLLAAKTGLICLYGVIMLLIYDFFKKKGFSKWTLILPPIIILMVCIIGYFIIPTFATKIQYVFHEISMFNSGAGLDYNYSSAGRLISYRIATEEISQHPFFGVGTGDVMQHMRMGYQKFYPEIPAKNHLIPHSQYLYNLLAYGLVFFPILISLVIAPFYVDRIRSKSYLYISATVLLVAMTFEAMLQVQLGLFIFLFFICIWYRWDRGADTELA